MKQSANIANLAKALVSAQKSIESGILKNAVNEVYNSTYADLGSVIRAIKDSLGNVGVAVIQSPTLTDAQGYVCLTTRLMHESGEWLEDTCSSPLQFNDPQAFGSAVSYLRRYALTAMLGLYQKDDDAGAATGLNRQNATATTAAPATTAASTTTAAVATTARVAATRAPKKALAVASAPADDVGTAEAAVADAEAVAEAVAVAVAVPTSVDGTVDGLAPDVRKRVNGWLTSISNASLDRLEASRSSIGTTFSGLALEIITQAFDERIAFIRADQDAAP